MRSTLGVRRVALGALIAISLAVATACSAGSSADGGKATRGGQLVIARGEENKTLDPAAAVSPADIAPIDEIYSRLFELGDDGKTIVASLAAQVPTSPDGVTWTIALRPGVTFSDGTPVH
ncbi:MAG: hypothetical protein JWO46_176, partial [Nocardioidaceae bacterium]|nr:hypothetical protein [Nocardioidaceae bacterium]